MGWEPAEFTEHEYDEQNRLVRSVTTREPEWDDEERGWMLALAVYRASLCPHCGRPLSVCTDPESEGRWVVPPPRRCFASTALRSAVPEYRDSPQPEALLLHAERR
ncbi:hypothetical protein ACFWC6_30690 [Micromonospora chalcea]